MNISPIVSQLGTDYVPYGFSTDGFVGKAIELLKSGQAKEARNEIVTHYNSNIPTETELVLLSLSFWAVDDVESGVKLLKHAREVSMPLDPQGSRPQESTLKGQLFYRGCEAVIDLIEKAQRKEQEKAESIDANWTFVDSKTKEAQCVAWYRGEHCSYFPDKDQLAAPGALEEYVLKGWLPPKPFITRDMEVTTFGSCFAGEVRQYLDLRGFRVGNPNYKKSSQAGVVYISEGLNNTFVVLQQFEWAYLNREFPENLWYNSEKQVREYKEEIRQATKQLFETSSVFIITLGLSEVWYNKKTNDVFWRAIPKHHFDESIHGFRVSGVQENLDNLQKTVQIIRDNRGDVPIIFTLSPVPLVATFRPTSIVSANSVSKAILRVAVDELMRSRADDANLHYFPSYEIVTNYLPDPFEGDNRHVKRPDVVNFIMDAFGKYYLID